jgi:exopolysaccharide biosynthesis polyprenyl glycosylphosphotransferase
VTSASATTTVEEARADLVAVPTLATDAQAVVEGAAARGRSRLRPRAEWALARFSLDFAMLGMGAAVAETGWRAAGFAPTPLVWVVAFPLLALALLVARDAYEPRLGSRLFDEIRKVAAATAVAAMAVTTARVILADTAVPSTQAVRPWLFATACAVAGRCVLTWAERRARTRGEMLRPTLILGAGRVGQTLAARLLAAPELGLRPIGFLDKEPLDGPRDVPVLGASWDLERVVADHGVEHVVVTFSKAPNDVVLRLAKRCEALGVDVSFVPRLFERTPERLAVDHVGGIALLTPRATNGRGVAFAVKYAFDRVAGSLLLLLFLPLLALIALAVLVSMGRPVFFRQARISLDGREFGMVKFRTMRGRPEDRGEADADWAAQELGGAAAVPAVAATEDRRTPLGRVLRASSLDELPQLWNVVVGDMSLVGPRPERAHYARRFGEGIYRYAERHRVKSGITGWAQVNGLRGKTSLADRVEWDNFYIENWSLWLDVRILARTPLALLRRAED